jgi:hypothetical protein
MRPKVRIVDYLVIATLCLYWTLNFVAGVLWTVTTCTNGEDGEMEHWAMYLYWSSQIILLLGLALLAFADRKYEPARATVVPFDFS